jgi:hypothetical protein
MLEHLVEPGAPVIQPEIAAGRGVVGTGVAAGCAVSGAAIASVRNSSATARRIGSWPRTSEVYPQSS